MTLSHSRHFYAEIVFDQSSWTWLRLHQEAFHAFGGVPAKIILDNLKAGIIKASMHDPLIQRSYRNLAEHYGFMVSPNRPRTPRHKGKVERNIRYLKQNFLPGRKFRDIADANEQLCKWNDEIASIRIHGTTGWKPLERFEAVEQKALLPLPQGELESFGLEGGQAPSRLSCRGRKILLLCTISLDRQEIGSPDSWLSGADF